MVAEAEKNTKDITTNIEQVTDGYGSWIGDVILWLLYFHSLKNNRFTKNFQNETISFLDLYFFKPYKNENNFAFSNYLYVFDSKYSLKQYEL